MKIFNAVLYKTEISVNEGEKKTAKNQPIFDQKEFFRDKKKNNWAMNKHIKLLDDMTDTFKLRLKYEE